MKLTKRAIFFLSLFLCQFVKAQVPQALNYQAVARSADGSILSAQSVGVRFSVLEGSASGASVYQETHRTSTNNFGLFTLSIGKGTPVSGRFANINWATGSKFLKVEIALQGVSNYQLQGTTQLLSAPYALYAEKSGSAGPQGPQGIPGPIGPQGPQGIPGTNGKSILNGTVNPAANLGVEGDFYINTTTMQGFGPKTTGGWGTGISLVNTASVLKSLIDLEDFSSSVTCASGGVLIKTGVDQNNNNILDATEVSDRKEICFPQKAPADKLVILPLNWSANTTSTTPVIGGGIIKFNKNNYPGVDSIILVCDPYVGSSSNTANLQLFNITDNVSISNSSISTNNLYIGSGKGYIQSGNVYASLPNHDITLGVSLKSGNNGMFAATGTCYLYLYRR